MNKICSVAAEKAKTKIKESRRTGDCENFQKESEKILDKNEYPLYKWLSTIFWRGIEAGHNEAVLKTVCPKGRVGSNPTLSVSKTVINFIRYEINLQSTQEVEGAPLERELGRLVAARGFKSLLLRSMRKHQEP